MKAIRQPRVRVIAGTSRGATTAPTLVPALNRPIASARSLRGNHSVTAASDAGNAPDSPSASGMRAIAKPTVERARAWAMWPTVHSVTARANPARAPIRSTIRPKAT